MEKGLEDMQKGQEETKARMENMQRSQEEIKNELKERVEKVVEEKIKKVGEEIGRIKEQVEEIGRIKEQVEERIEEVAGNFTQRFKELEKKLLACGNTRNESKFVPASSVSMPASPVPLTASPVTVKLSTYDGKTNWEVYKTQFSIISEANGWTEGVKECRLVASLRGEATEVLQTLQDTERLNLNSLYNASDLRFGQKYSKEYSENKTPENRRKLSGVCI
ncbi:uncharacterized protein TNCV_478251 [Trichonephila clavipes]|nr:uncharacterized protein TNCV_478251 [Trichonephila clavipes]